MNSFPFVARGGGDEEVKKVRVNLVQIGKGKKKVADIQNSEKWKPKQRISSPVELLEPRRMQTILPNIISVMLPPLVLTLNLTSLTLKDVFIAIILKHLRMDCEGFKAWLMKKGIKLIDKNSMRE